jgi:toxin ParE1/3/4
MKLELASTGSALHEAGVRRSRGRRSREYLSLDWDSPAAARIVVRRLFSSLELLVSFPLMGRAGRARGTYEWPVPRLPYIAVYEVDEAQDRVIVTAIFDGAQDREGEGW